MSEKKSKGIAKRVPVLLIAAVLVVGVVAGAGIWLITVNVPIEYDEPYTVSMSQNETSPTYEWRPLPFKDTTTTETAYFNETGSGLSYHQYVQVDNPAGTDPVNVNFTVQEPDAFSNQMGFTVNYTGIMEPGEEGKLKVDTWGMLEGSIVVDPGEVRNITVVYTLNETVPTSNGHDVVWDFYEVDEDITTAGADLSTYETPDTYTTTVTDGNSIQTAIDSASEEDIIGVEAGTYSPFDVNKNVTVVAKNGPLTSDAAEVSANGDMAAIDVIANGSTVKGFDVTANNGDTRDNARGIDVKAARTTIVKNYVHDVTSRVRPIGIHVFGQNVDTNETVLSNNLIEKVKATDLDGSESGQGESKTRGVVISGPNTATNNDNITVSDNTIRDIGDDQSAMSNGVEIHGGTAQNFTISYNDIREIDHNESFDYAPYAMDVYVTGYNEGISYGANHEVSYNNLHFSGSDTLSASLFDVPDATEKLNAENNWWDTTDKDDIRVSDGIDYEPYLEYPLPLS